MAHLKQTMDDHRDLYLEILKKAEKEYDRDLIQMITKKLESSLPHPDSTPDGCQVFSFPLAKEPTAKVKSSETLFWKDGQFWQNLVQLMAFMGLAVCYFIFFGRLFFSGF